MAWACPEDEAQASAAHLFRRYEATVVAAERRGDTLLRALNVLVGSQRIPHDLLQQVAEITDRMASPEPVPSPEALEWLAVGERHGGRGCILTEAEIREAEAERGGRL
jgi:hypothetical protein